MVAQLAATEGLLLDACAAPGGKSLLLADYEGVSRVIAAEASLRRVRTLERLRARWGASRVLVVAADARRPPFRAPFDCVLLDVPCSGLGTIARHPDIRWRLRGDDIARHGERQRSILEALAPLVRPGGRLVYASCSVEPEENEDVVRPFLSTHPDFTPEALPAWAEAHREGAFVRMEPASGGGDAFFAARLRRRDVVTSKKARSIGPNPCADSESFGFSDATRCSLQP
jgi:16S rRNA (cytosine967-C5)-methyltransferase